MPYSIPATPPVQPPVHSQARPRYHHRSYTDAHGPGAFAPIGVLPRRRPNVTPVFHFRNDQDGSSPDNTDSDDDEHTPNVPPPPKLKLKLNSSFDTAPIPFPRSSPTIRSSVARTTSAPTTRRPLKSSLKSSSSSSSISSPSTSPSHHRAYSVPPSPTHKNVHFPSPEGGLATIRFYSLRARPTSISLPVNQDDTEDDTETEYLTGFPFPHYGPKYHATKVLYELDPSASSSVPTSNPPAYANVHLESLVLISSPSSLPLLPLPNISLKGSLLVRNIAYEKTVAIRFTLDEWNTTSEVLAHHTASLPSLPTAFFHPGWGLISRDASTSLSPVGKNNENDAETLAPRAPEWDRFSFTISLDDYAPTLAQRTLWLVARYRTPYIHTHQSSHPSEPAMASSTTTSSSMDHLSTIPMTTISGGGEWWDNNGGENYRVGFKTKEVEAARTSPLGRLDEKGQGLSPREKDRQTIQSEEISRQRKIDFGAAPLFIPPAPLPSASISTAASANNFHHHHPSAYQAARTQTTLAHLRGLSLKNYAAPMTGFSLTTSPNHSSSESTTSTATSSPMSPLSPIDGFGGFELGMVAGYPATIGGPVSPNRGSIGEGVFTASTSPPRMSMPARGGKDKEEETKANGSEKEKEREEKAGNGSASGISLYWPWGGSTPTVKGGDVPFPRSDGGENEEEGVDAGLIELMKNATKRRQQGGSEPVPVPGRVRPSISRESSLESIPEQVQGVSTSGGSNTPVVRSPVPVLAGRPSPASALGGRRSSPSLMVPGSVQSPIPPALIAQSSPIPMPLVGVKIPSPTYASLNGTPTHTPTPSRTEDLAADSLYQAFVKKWCFAHEGVKG